MPKTAGLTVHELDLNHIEAVAPGPDGLLYAGGERGEIYRIDLERGRAEQFADTGGSVLGLALDAAANLYACDLTRREVLRISPDGRCDTYSSGRPDRPMRLPNFPVFDDQGRLYVSDSGDWAAGDGLIWRIDAEGRAEMWSASASGFTNGMCLSADGTQLYVAESSPPLVSRLEIRRDGSVGDRSVLFRSPETVPDGLALDSDGNLWISLYHPNRVYRYRPDGQLDLIYDDWEQQALMTPTNLAFCGSGLNTLVMANLGGRHLTTAPASTPGLRLRYPRLS